MQCGTRRCPLGVGRPERCAGDASGIRRAAGRGAARPTRAAAWRDPAASRSMSGWVAAPPAWVRWRPVYAPPAPGVAHRSSAPSVPGWPSARTAAGTQPAPWMRPPRTPAETRARPGRDLQPVRRAPARVLKQPAGASSSSRRHGARSVDTGTAACAATNNDSAASGLAAEAGPAAANGSRATCGMAGRAIAPSWRIRTSGARDAIGHTASMTGSGCGRWCDWAIHGTCVAARDRSNAGVFRATGAIAAGAAEALKVTEDRIGRRGGHPLQAHRRGFEQIFERGEGLPGPLRMRAPASAAVRRSVPGSTRRRW